MLDIAEIQKKCKYVNNGSTRRYDVIHEMVDVQLSWVRVLTSCREPGLVFTGDNKGCDVYQISRKLPADGKGIMRLVYQQRPNGATWGDPTVFDTVN
jgi:hypothetical protein